MSALTITVNGQTQVVQLGTLSAAVNQQITQAVASSTASATTASQAATTATTEAGLASAAATTATTEAGVATAAAGTATTEAGIATGAASTATTEAGIATTQAGSASTSAGAASTSAGAASSSASAAAASAVTAAAAATAFTTTGVSVATNYAVPIAIPGSASSITATGAVSGLTTAFPRVLTGVARVYMFLAAAGGVSGLYYARFSSTTAFQLYTDAAGTITPTGLTAGAYTGQTTLVQLAAPSIPGGAMGASSIVRMSSSYSMNNSGTVKTATVSFGGTLILSEARGNVGGLQIATVTRNRAAQNSQWTTWQSFRDSGAIAGSALATTVDTSSAQAFSFSAALGGATDYVILEGYNAEILPSS